jgi:hypothetical protein
MGKTVTAIVGVAAAIGIAIAAPYLGGLLATAVLGATATATAVAIATALVTVALSVAVGLAFRALGVGAPSAKDATLAPQGTAVVAMFAFPFTSEYALEPVMPAVRGSRMGRLIFGRWRIHELHGFCMGPEFTGFAIIDVDADIRRGDLFSFSTRDFKTAWPEAQTGRHQRRRQAVPRHQPRARHHRMLVPGAVLYDPHRHHEPDARLARASRSADLLGRRAPDVAREARSCGI